MHCGGCGSRTARAIGRRASAIIGDTDGGAWLGRRTGGGVRGGGILRALSTLDAGQERGSGSGSGLHSEWHCVTEGACLFRSSAVAYRLLATLAGCAVGSEWRQELCIPEDVEVEDVSVVGERIKVRLLPS